MQNQNQPTVSKLELVLLVEIVLHLSIDHCKQLKTTDLVLRYMYVNKLELSSVWNELLCFKSAV